MTADGGSLQRVSASGKFFYAGADKLLVRGVTYGTFAGPEGFPSPDVVARDFDAMQGAGINTVRTYTVPPRWLLDAAAARGLRAIVGLPWEQHLTFLDSRARREAIVRTVRTGARSCAGHSAVLAYAVGNEIPTSIVRWHGASRIERFLRRLTETVRDADPQALVTYANYPSTEYLELDFLDFMAFNVYLERPRAFARYLERLQVLAGERPLVVAELGLDSQRHGQERQALSVGQQLRDAFAGGCAGAVAFAWTDEWVRNGDEVRDWSFGLVDCDRSPKPALAAARRAFSEARPAASGSESPVSVVVCTHNGARTLAECLDGVARLEYPDFEVIVVDDGSTDATPRIAGEREGVRVISSTQRGLGAARNAGIEAARGEIVAFLDDDCVPDADWLRYAVARLRSDGHAGAGGPNIPPPDEGLVARCVARAPGAPTHVLASDTRAEHLAGCNMVFWKDALVGIGGFDERFWQAGDDVDLCWQVEDAGLTLGFSAAAVVWHRRRASIRAYLRQQRSYGRAEALLERKWPERYNGAGHVTWSGSVYGGSLTHRRRRTIDYGVWGQGLFQSACEHRSVPAAVTPLIPESYMALLGLGVAAAVSPWAPLVPMTVLGLPAIAIAFLAALVTVVTRAVRAGWRVTRTPRASRAQRLLETAVVALLAVLQPQARLSGRLRAGLTPWRRRPGRRGFSATHVRSVWSERNRQAAEWLTLLRRGLRSTFAVVSSGSRCDRWDLSVRTGALGAVRVQLALEEHGNGRQLLRWRIAPRPSPGWLGVAGALGSVAALATFTASTVWAVGAGAAALVIAARVVSDCLSASAAVERVLASWVAEGGLAGCARVAPSRAAVIVPRPPAIAALPERGQLPAALREAR